MIIIIIIIIIIITPTRGVNVHRHRDRGAEEVDLLRLRLRLGAIGVHRRGRRGYGAEKKIDRAQDTENHRQKGDRALFTEGQGTWLGIRNRKGKGALSGSHAHIIMMPRGW
jgi:hypothetical protein